MCANAKGLAWLRASIPPARRTARHGSLNAISFLVHVWKRIKLSYIIWSLFFLLIIISSAKAWNGTGTRIWSFADVCRTLHTEPVADLAANCLGKPRRPTKTDKDGRSLLSRVTQSYSHDLGVILFCLPGSGNIYFLSSFLFLRLDAACKDVCTAVVVHRSLFLRQFLPLFFLLWIPISCSNFCRPYRG